MKIQSVKLIVLCVAVALLVFVGMIVYESKTRFSPLTREDLPAGAVFVKHTHPNKAPEVDENGRPKEEMEHYTTPEATRNNGPIYGVYGYRIVSLEYEFPESEIKIRPVGQDFPGWGLASSFFGFKRAISYNHFHIGIKEDRTGGEKRYLIHFMLLPHEEEVAIGLSCG